MRYVFEAGRPRRVMHIQRHLITGQPLFDAICRIGLPFNRTINAPFALGRRVCRRCIKLLEEA